MPGKACPQLSRDQADNDAYHSRCEYDTKFTTCLSPAGADEPHQIDRGESTAHHAKPAYATPAQNLENAAENLAHLLGT